MRLKVELRKIDGQRFARFTALSNIPSDSPDAQAVSEAMQECEIMAGGNIGLFSHWVTSCDSERVSCLGGVDIPVAKIEVFTQALTAKGFQVV